MTHLAAIRQLSCAVCAVPPTVAQIQAAHVRIGGNAGIGIKPKDSRTVPLCASCHAEQHNTGEATFWRNHGRATADAISLGLTLHSASPDVDAMKQILETWR